MIELQNHLALAALPLALLVYWWYRQRRLPTRAATAVWLLKSGRRRSARFRRWDLRLLALLAAFTLLVLAAAAPVWRGLAPARLVLVVDASASMAARDGTGSTRLARAKELAKPWLRRAGQAVLVRAGLEPQTFGPKTGTALLGDLESLRAGDAAADLAEARAAGLRLLPGARVLIVSDAAPPAGPGAYLNVAGRGANAGITALGPGFAAVFNAGSGVWRGRLLSEGESHSLQIAPGRYGLVRFAKNLARRRAALEPGGDALRLDDVAYSLTSAPRVRLTFESKALERALLAVGARLVANAPDAIITTGAPAGTNARPTLYFASQAGQREPVAELDPTSELSRGLELSGLGFALPQPPPPGWRALARTADGDGVIWQKGADLYLPPLADWRDRPQLVVLLYNWLAPLANRTRPLGADGVLQPGFNARTAYSLLSPGETDLPRPRPSEMAGLGERQPLAPWLILLAALLLVLAGRLRQPAPAR